MIDEELSSLVASNIGFIARLERKTAATDRQQKATQRQTTQASHEKPRPDGRGREGSASR